MADIYGNDRDAFHNIKTSHTEDKKVSSDETFSIAKVFFYVFIGLLITTVIAVIGGAIYRALPPEQGAKAYLALSLIGGVGMIIDAFIINMTVFKGKGKVLPAMIIFCILTGLMLSGLTVVFDGAILGAAFGITCLIFLLMSLIGFLSKGNLSPLLIVAMGIIMGSGLLALGNWIYMLVTGTSFQVLYWAVSFGIFAFIILVTIVDLWQMKKIAEQGALSGNVALYCAFHIYVDFINIFLRILYYLAIIFGKRR